MKTLRVFGYQWEDIQRAQRGGRLHQPLPAQRTASIKCAKCQKYFRLDMVSKLVRCMHCDYEQVNPL